MNQFEGKPPIAGRYQIQDHIATGGMASVYKTWDKHVERTVAIKVLRSLDKNDLRAVERFRREARAAAALTHPNAVTIYDFVEQWGQYFLVMEFIDGPTLKQVIHQSRQMPALQAIEIAAQVCDVLQVAHARGFIHRDIKPQNIMLAWSGNRAERPLVKLTDFGIVRVLEEGGLTNSGIVLGTADYLSPEQARGETLTASSDLYSLGVVMFEMLAGRPPFVGPTAVSIAMQHASANPPPLRQYNSTVPPSVEQIVMRTLQKEPEERFQSAEEMKQTLRQCAKELSRANQSRRANGRGMPLGGENVSSSPLQPPGYPSSVDGRSQMPPAKRGQFSP